MHIWGSEGSSPTGDRTRVARLAVQYSTDWATPSSCNGRLKQVEIYTPLLTFSLLLGKIPLCRPKIIPIHQDISMWISFHVWLHFYSHKAHIVSINLWTILMIHYQLYCLMKFNWNSDILAILGYIFIHNFETIYHVYARREPKLSHESAFYKLFNGIHYVGLNLETNENLLISLCDVHFLRNGKKFCSLNVCIVLVKLYVSTSGHNPSWTPPLGSMLTWRFKEIGIKKAFIWYFIVKLQTGNGYAAKSGKK